MYTIFSTRIGPQIQQHPWLDENHLSHCCNCPAPFPPHSDTLRIWTKLLQFLNKINLQTLCPLPPLFFHCSSRQRILLGVGQYVHSSFSTFDHVSRRTFLQIFPLNFTLLEFLPLRKTLKMCNFAATLQPLRRLSFRVGCLENAQETLHSSTPF